MVNLGKAICIASVALCLHLPAFSQDISLRMKNVTVKEAIEKLKEKSGYSFVFSSVDVNTNLRVTLSVQNATVDEVVKQLLQGQEGLTYEISGKNIVIKKKRSDEPARAKATGRVVDENGDPVIGATVREQGTSNGVATDMDGRFSVDVVAGTSLEISYIGYRNQVIKVQKGKKLEVVLSEDSNLLDEVVVLGYGNIRRSDVTGSVASVSSEAISKVASASVADALAGKMAGVQITTADGSLDAEISVRVRGGGSITQDNSPCSWSMVFRLTT